MILIRGIFGVKASTRAAGHVGFSLVIKWRTEELLAGTLENIRSNISIPRLTDGGLTISNLFLAYCMTDNASLKVLVFFFVTDKSAFVMRFYYSYQGK